MLFLLCLDVSDAGKFVSGQKANFSEKLPAFILRKITNREDPALFATSSRNGSPNFHLCRDAASARSSIVQASSCGG